METNMSRSRVLRVITISQWTALGVGVILIVFYKYVVASLLSCLAMCAFGAALSPVVAKQYKTGELKYSLLYGALLGIGLTVFDTAGVEPTATNPFLSSLYAGMCTVFGGSLVFAIFKQHLLRYLSPSDAQTS